MSYSKLKIIQELKKCRDFIRNNNEGLIISLNKDGFPDVWSPDGMIKNPPYNPEYVPNLKKFLNDKKYPHKIVIGAYGSGKTSGFVNCILRDAILMPKCDDGIRRSKVILVRGTAAQLETTTLQTWLFWTKGFPSPYRSKKPQLTYSYKFNDREGTILLDVLFLALDREDDIAKLDSLELTSAFVNELRHVPEKIFYTILSRIGRYPAKIEFMHKYSDEMKALSKKKRLDFKDWTPYVPHLYADSNAPKNRHWIAQLEKKNLAKIKVYHQPPALLKDKKGEWIINDNADNLDFVGKTYYLDMVDRGEEFIKVYAQGKYGTVVDGNPVFPYYNDDLHSVDHIEFIKDETIYIGCDYGTISPAVLLLQFVKGQILAIKEFIGEYETIKDLFKGEIIPYLNLNCKGFPLDVVGDPANTAQGVQQLAELNIFALPARTNKVETRVASVANALNELINGKPRLLISRKGCSILREGFLGEYHYRRLRIVGDDKYVDTPNKTHPYSDIQDCLQYVVMKILEEINYDHYSKDYKFYSLIDESHRSNVTGY